MTDRIEIDATVVDLLPGTKFRVIYGEASSAIVTISGKMRQNNIRIIAGDRVKVELSEYDLTRGRIVYRYK